MSRGTRGSKAAQVLHTPRASFKVTHETFVAQAAPRRVQLRDATTSIFTGESWKNVRDDGVPCTPEEFQILAHEVLEEIRNANANDKAILLCPLARLFPDFRAA